VINFDFWRGWNSVESSTEVKIVSTQNVLHTTAERKMKMKEKKKGKNGI